MVIVQIMPSIEKHDFFIWKNITFLLNLLPLEKKTFIWKSFHLNTILLKKNLIERKIKSKKNFIGK